MSDADTTMKTAKFDWSRADATTDEQVHAAAMKDPDARPMTDAEWDADPKVPRAKTLPLGARSDAGRIRGALSDPARHAAA